jgi:hypothetical protein
MAGHSEPGLDIFGPVWEALIEPDLISRSRQAWNMGDMFPVAEKAKDGKIDERYNLLPQTAMPSDLLPPPYAPNAS